MSALPTDPNELAQALDIAERAALWVERIREFALDQLQQQIPIPGWRTDPDPGHPEVGLPEADMTRLAHLIGAVERRCLRDPAALAGADRRRF